MNKILIAFIVLIAGAFLANTYVVKHNRIPDTDDTTIPPTASSTVITDINRIATEAEIGAVVNASNQFAFDYFAQLLKKSEKGNVFFSPYSITTALGMTYEGARGQTAEEMQRVLHIPQNGDARRAATLAIYNGLNSSGKDFTLKTANALWAEKDYAFQPDFFSTIRSFYQGTATNLDFIGNSEAARTTINKWVENQTNEKIKDLLPQGSIGADTRLVLTNAIYFKGKWVLQFDKKDTKKEDFATNSGTKVQADMMKLAGEKVQFKYAENDSAQILNMPYKGNELSMSIILPKSGSQVEKNLDVASFASLTKSLVKRRVDVFIPKLKFTTTASLANDLKIMGMPTAFSDEANFLGMTATKDLKITDVIHKAFVEVNEEGTEAAAATGVIVGLTSAPLNPPPIPVFRADHPFIFFIQNDKTGQVLFMGKVNNPTLQ